MFDIFFYLTCIMADHKFESGYVNHFSYYVTDNLVLYTSSNQFREEEFFIAFKKQFTSVPDVQQQQIYQYLKVALVDLEFTFPQGYSTDITSISTDGFQVKVVCESTSKFYSFEFNWFAFNDEKVQVINNFNITNPQTKYTHSYQKQCEINVAISNFVSYYALGPQYNQLTGLTLTPETVTINFYFESLTQFGYQILLSSSDIFLIGPTLINLQTQGSSQVVNFPSGWPIQNCFSNFLGFKHDGSENVRFFTNTTYSSQVTVGIYTWFSSIFQSVQHNYFCINDAFFELAKFDNLKQSRFFDLKNIIDTHIEIKEINYSQNQFLEEETTIPQSIQSMSIIFFWKCLGQEILQLQLFCPHQWCSSTQIKCDTNRINTVRLSAKFFLNQNSQQYIKIAKTSAQLTATQVIKQTNQFEKQLIKLVAILPFYNYFKVANFIYNNINLAFYKNLKNIHQRNRMISSVSILISLLIYQLLI